MNIPWEQLIFQWGGFGVLAFFFYLFLRSDWKRQDCERQKWNEREKRWETIIGDALEMQNSSNVIISNCFVHQEQEFREQAKETERLVHAVDRLCEKI